MGTLGVLDQLDRSDAGVAVCVPAVRLTYGTWTATTISSNIRKSLTEKDLRRAGQPDWPPQPANIRRFDSLPDTPLEVLRDPLGEAAGIVIGSIARYFEAHFLRRLRRVFIFDLLQHQKQQHANQ